MDKELDKAIKDLGDATLAMYKLGLGHANYSIVESFLSKKMFEKAIADLEKDNNYCKSKV